jgi:hypothetical protein
MQALRSRFVRLFSSELAIAAQPRDSAYAFSAATNGHDYVSRLLDSASELTSVYRKLSRRMARSSE